MRGMSKRKLSERNIVIEKSKHLCQIGVFVQQNNSQTNTPRVQASGSHSFIHSFIHIRLINIRNTA